jgi:putative ABC transport system substrate-binding protein
MRRRAFLTLLGGAAATWPVAARTQQPAMPVIGYLSVGTLKSEASLLAAFRQGLAAGGFVEGRNVSLEYRFADGHYEQLPSMAADLARRRVALIFSGGGTGEAAKAATPTIPIVFSMNGDAVRGGMVASLARPGGNVTGVSNLGGDVTTKRLQLMHDLVPAAARMAYLTNPSNPVAGTSPLLHDVQAAAASLSIDLHVIEATSERDFEAAFAKVAEVHAGALAIGPDPYFTARAEQLAGLALRHGVPASYQFREFAAAGGLMSYGGSISEGYRLAGTYAARILKGEKPGDLPVQQVTKIELVINLNTAKALGLGVSQDMLSIADEVIE